MSCSFELIKFTFFYFFLPLFSTSYQQIFTGHSFSWMRIISAMKREGMPIFLNLSFFDQNRPQKIDLKSIFQRFDLIDISYRNCEKWENQKLTKLCWLFTKTMKKFSNKFKKTMKVRKKQEKIDQWNKINFSIASDWFSIKINFQI